MKSDSAISSRSFWRNSLAGRFVLLTVVVVLVVMSISAFVNYKNQKNTILDNIRTQTQMLGNFVSSIAPETLLSYDFDALNEYMKEITNGEDVVFAAIFSPEGDALTSHLQRNNHYIASYLLHNKAVDFREIIKQLDGNENIIHQRFPILFEQQLLGYFDIGISKNRIEEISRKKLVGQLAISTVLTILLGFAIYMVFRFYTMRPILQLVEGAKRISKGKLTEKVRVYSRDELGRLAISFNQMMKQLRRGIEEKDHILEQIKELNQTLEIRVEQRTRELETANQKLEQLAMRDALTNLPNRYCIQDKLNQYISNAYHNRMSFAVIMMDLDRFKDINDTLGHDCGDQLLVELSLRLHGVLRPSDMIGRLGGDEFAILLPNTGEDGARIVAEKVHQTLEQSFRLQNMAFTISASLGIAVFPDHGSTTSAILKSADIAMYYAKHRRLEHCVYDSSLNGHSTERLTLMGDLREAVNHGALELYYQPKVSLAEERIVGVEVLARWNHPQRGFIPPEIFIPMAEQSGLIRPLTHWVVSTALSQCEQWHRQGIEVSVSINLSVHNLQDADFPEALSDLLSMAKIDHKYIQFEITESTIMTNPEYVQGVLIEMGKMGVSFAIDDFGTGYSSLSILKKLPVQELKIDKSFVMDMADDTDDEAIVHSIVDMAHNLGLNVIAEGVENITVTRQLSKLGCDLIQGYYISRPLPVEQMTDMLGDLYWSYTEQEATTKRSSRVTPIK